MRLYLKESLSLLGKTLPFLWLKLLVYFLTGLVFLVFSGLMLYIAFKFSGMITLIVIIIGLLVLWGFVTLLRRYVFYLIKAGHIAVLGELIQQGKLPDNTGMVSYGFQKVKSKFVSASVFFVLDAIINAVVQGISNFIRRIGNLIPVQSIQRLFTILSKIISIFLNYIDEAILSFIFVHPNNNPWKGARDGLVLYFKAWKTLLPVATVLVLISYGLTFIIFYGSFLLTAPISSFLPFIFKDAPFLVALFVAILIKVTFIDQYTLVAMIVAYQESIKNLTPDSQTADKLGEMVPKFKEILSKAGK